MTAVLSNDCSSAIPSTLTTFFHTLASDSTLLESTADASFPVKVIRVLFVKQCNISPSTTKSDLGIRENSYVPVASWRLISGRDWHTIMRRANKHRSSFNSNIFLFTTIFVFFVAFFQAWSSRFFISDHRFSLLFECTLCKMFWKVYILQSFAHRDLAWFSQASQI